MILLSTLGWLVVVAVAAVLARRRRRWLVRVPAVALAVTATFALAGYLWYFHRPQPAPIERELFVGVHYTREVQREPWPMVAHIVRVDLTAPGIAFQTTPADRSAGMEFRAQTTGEFLRRSGAQLAINGGFFEPYRVEGLFDYYPHSGDPVDVWGMSVYDGQFASRDHGLRSLVIERDGSARIDDHVTTGWQVISGQPLALNASPKLDLAAGARRHPRTAVALDDERRTLLLVVVDGRQPNYSEGATLGELADLIRRHGGTTAVNLDGGGSSTLAVRDGDRIRVLNTPIQTRIPGRQRPVANHLAVFAQPLGSAPADTPSNDP